MLAERRKKPSLQIEFGFLNAAPGLYRRPLPRYPLNEAPAWSCWVLWRHQNGHIRYAFTPNCRPSAVQKTALFRALRRIGYILTISSARDDPWLWDYVLRWGYKLRYSDLAGRCAYKDYLQFPRFRCRKILRPI